MITNPVCEWVWTVQESKTVKRKEDVVRTFPSFRRDGWIVQMDMIERRDYLLKGNHSKCYFSVCSVWSCYRRLEVNKLKLIGKEKEEELCLNTMIHLYPYSIWIIEFYSRTLSNFRAGSWSSKSLIISQGPSKSWFEKNNNIIQEKGEDRC